MLAYRYGHYKDIALTKLTVKLPPYMASCDGVRVGGDIPSRAKASKLTWSAILCHSRDSCLMNNSSLCYYIKTFNGHNGYFVKA